MERCPGSPMVEGLTVLSLEMKKGTGCAPAESEVGSKPWLPP